MLSTESLIDALYNWRRDKLAITLLVGLMGGDSVTEAADKLEKLLPHIKNIDVKSRKHQKDKLKVDHDIARRTYDLATEIYPWLRQVADLENNA